MRPATELGADDPLVLKIIELTLAGLDKDGNDVVRVQLNRNVPEEGNPRAASVAILVPLDEARAFYPIGELVRLDLVPVTQEAPHG